VSNLALKYRPRTFGDVVGQRPSVAVLFRMCRRGTVPGCLLLHGKHGSGKTTMARIVAKALNCAAPPGPAGSWPCGQCASCRAIDADASPDVTEIDAASNGNVEQIRRVRESAQYGTLAGSYRVYIIDEAHGLSAAAFEALLKILEEPPPGTVFILITTQVKSVPATIQSRSSPFKFDPLTTEQVAGRLAEICRLEGLATEPALVAAIAEAAQGAMRDAVVRLDQVASVDVHSLEAWQELTGETDFAPGLLLATADGDAAAMYAAMDAALAAYGDPGHVTRELVRCLADLQVLCCGGPVTAQGEALEARKALAARLGPARVLGAMTVLWDLHARVRIEDRRACLQLALSQVGKALCPPPAVPAPIAAGGGQPASLDFMRTALGR
jgi:DNA polymerase-3 subunit gamma/tau